MPQLRLSVSQAGDTVEAMLPMPLPYLPVPRGFYRWIIVVPIYLLVFVIYTKLLGIKPPPRIRCVIAPGRFQMEFVSPKTGEQTKLECDPAKIAEFRKNQYGKGLYVHVSGQIIHTYMEDYGDDEVVSFAKQVRDLLNATLGLSISDTPR